MVYSSLTAADSQKYLVVKSAVLKANEAYQQQHRVIFKFARDVTSHFTHWHSAALILMDCVILFCLSSLNTLFLSVLQLTPVSRKQIQLLKQHLLMIMS